MSRWLLATVFFCGVASIGSAQETPVFGDPQEIANEAYFRQVLRQPISVSFKEVPLAEVAAELRQKLGVHVMLDTKALEDVGAGGDTPITFECEELPARAVLDLILHGLDLSWISSNVLMITTPEKAGSELIVRVYPVADLAAVSVDGAATLDYDSLIDMISTTVATTTWDDVGGPGTISPLPAAGSLVLSQTREIHEQVEQLLQAVRAARDGQGLLIEDTGTALQNHWREQVDFQRAAAEQTEQAQESGGGFFSVDAIADAAEPVAVQGWQQPRRHE